MENVNGLLNKLEEKYGIASNIAKKAKPGDCSHFLYDEDCNECKGNAMGN